MGSGESKLNAINAGDNSSDVDYVAKENSEFDQLFTKYDLNSDGFLNANEVTEAIKHHSNVKPELKNDLLELLNEMEMNKPINRDDFREMMNIYTGKTTNNENIIDVFKTFDKNLSGSITEKEICHVFGKIGLNLNEEQGKTLIKEADKDGDGYLDFEEFLRIIISK